MLRHRRGSAGGRNRHRGGVLRIADAYTNADLLWALKGGGGGSFGVVTRMILHSRALPEYFGDVFTIIGASSDAPFRRLIGQFVEFYAANPLNPIGGHHDNAAGQCPHRANVVSRSRPAAGGVAHFLGGGLSRSGLRFTIALRMVELPAQHLRDPACGGLLGLRSDRITDILSTKK
jgi:hypothetical protein